MNQDWGQVEETVARNRSNFSDKDWANLWPEGRYFGTIEGGDVLIAIAQRVQKLEKHLEKLEAKQDGKRE